MKRSLSFNESFPKYEKRKKDPNYESSWEADEEKREKRMFDNQYDKQLKENVDYARKQANATNQFISDKEWEDLDSESGPKASYSGALELQEGPELQANLYALENRGPTVGKKLNKKTGEDISKKGVWGGKTRKSRKGKKGKKTKKARKGKKSRKMRKSRK